MESKLEVEVHSTHKDTPPIYRLYVDDELFTERTFTFDPSTQYINENLYCLLDSGVHVLKLVADRSSIEIKNFRVNGNPVQQNFLRVIDNGYTWNFVLDRVVNNQNVTSASGESLELRHRAEKPFAKKYETILPLVQKSRLLNSKINNRH